MIGLIPGGFGSSSGVVGSGWNPSDKNALVTLSTTAISNDTATVSGATTSPYADVRSLHSKNSGKLYFEQKLTYASTAAVLAAGMADASFTLTAGPGQSGNSFGWYPAFNGSHILTGSGGVFSVISQPASDWATGDVTQYAIDFGVGKVWVGKNGTMNGNPAAGTGHNLTFTAGTTLFPMFGVDESSGPTCSSVLRTGTAQLAFSVPTGFTPWG